LLSDIELKYDSLTEAQWNQFKDDLIGQRVSWKAKVREVKENGTVYLDMGQSMFYSVYLKGLPMYRALELKKGEIIEFDATINDITTLFGLSVWLNSPVLHTESMIDRETQVNTLSTTEIMTPTPTELTIDEIVSMHKTSTDLQWKDYKSEILGQRVNWTASVMDVDEDGVVYLDIGQPNNYFVYLLELSGEDVLSLSKDDNIQFDATIFDFSSILGLGIYLNQPTLLSVE